MKPPPLGAVSSFSGLRSALSSIFPDRRRLTFLLGLSDQSFLPIAFQKDSVAMAKKPATKSQTTKSTAPKKSPPSPGRLQIRPPPQGAVSSVCGLRSALSSICPDRLRLTFLLGLSCQSIVPIAFQKESVAMAKKPATKSKTKKSSAAKKSTPAIKATPSDINDRQHLIDVIQAGTGCTGVAARETMSALLNTIQASLKKNQKVQLAGFGTFLVTKRAARKGVNPRDRKSTRLKASKSVRFKAGRTLKEAV